MFCPKCGKEVDENSRYCPNCGYDLESTIVADVVGEPSMQNTAPKGKVDGFAIAGFVLSFFVPILGVVFSGIYLGKTKGTKTRLKGFAIAGLIISIVMWVWNFISIYKGIFDVIENMETALNIFNI